MGLVALKELRFATMPSAELLDTFEGEEALLRQPARSAMPKYVITFPGGEGVGTRFSLAQEWALLERRGPLTAP